MKKYQKPGCETQKINAEAFLSISYGEKNEAGTPLAEEAENTYNY